MDNYSSSQRKRVSRARQRQEKRRTRREARHDAMATLQEESVSRIRQTPLNDLNLQPVSRNLGQAVTYARDTVWHLINRSPLLKLIPLVIIAILGIVWLVSQFSGQIPPNVWAMGVPLGGRSLEEAQAALLEKWANEEINIRLDGETFARVAPSELGLQLDAEAIVAEAQEQGIAGIPFGVSIEPVVSINAGTTQAYLLNQIDAVYIPPYDAGFAWENDRLISMSGTPSRELDVSATLDLIQFDPLAIYEKGQLDLQTNQTAPSSFDATPYVDAAYRLINNGLILTGYDPFIDEYKQWGTNKNYLTQMLAVGPAGLALREDRFQDLINVVNGELAQSEQPRYLEFDEAQLAVEEAITSGESEANVRIRYLPHEYVVESGDRGYSIARKNGMPFTLIEQANTDIDLDVLSVGDVITIPSRDAVVPFEPILGKRIVVDLDRKWLVGFENGEIAFDWQISTGMPQAPTSPGIFQILSKTEEAVGSSSDLCNSNGVCGQWRMEYFMGIYDVAENLTNGFHGIVHLANGGLLGDGAVGAQNTYGCVMSTQANSEFLYQWANEGTVVEIISSEFAPQSDLGRQAMSYMDTLFQST
ncbi:L,D-transpeptidase family protein [Phototrophicus methaneseepsis]|uniref:L,D-transpeptidase family protein n=1 Tax=Phototrophicus methaneseepsis TaxID=2710758 RepID=A0A7S8EDB8_9CHLR|nr:L,D-transpeptidase family protein [Phototrophicus methaneseepsis]QPC84861.1 L,D-transpeptidase family protein [Phototrophicus methaneseepsis]